ncbi:MAG: NAD-dependent epimerase/dehydratase family protein [Rikenellaceae bacterium]|nr:NAD-dependent epimerase/dehydratase family protein [Rikenellaceae bacterium]
MLKDKSIEKSVPLILITGANGFLATNIIEKLLEGGTRVRAQLRKKSGFRFQTEEWEASGLLEIVECDFSNSDILDALTKGIDCVIHVAAVTDPSLLKYEDYSRVNVEAVRNLIEASIKYGVKRFLFVSTANVFGYGTKEKPGDESLPIRPPFNRSLYAKSKVAGQNLAMSYSDKIEIISVNPTFMIGKYGDRNGSNRIITRAEGRSLKKGRYLLFVPPGGKNFINVENAAREIIKILYEGKNGKAYIVSGENLSYVEFYKLLKSVTIANFRIVKIPVPAMLIAGAAGSMLRLAGIKCPLSFVNAKILCVSNFYTNKVQNFAKAFHKV